MPAAQGFLVILTIVDIVFSRTTRIDASTLDHVAEQRSSRA